MGANGRQRTDERGSAREAVLARIFSVGLVAVILAVSLLGLEWWPLSAFRLFSLPRTDASVTWQLRAVDSAGTETTMNLGELPTFDSGSLQLTQQLATLDRSRQDAVLIAWMRGLGMDPRDYASVRVYRVDGHVPTGGATEPDPPKVTEVFEVPLP